MGELSPTEQRAALLARLSTQTWDLVVIGGGISGAGVAQQAARRGWSVLLVEQRDFAWGTSSRSSKLVHGGLRYLKEGDIQTTLHSVRERQRLLREAPGLVEPQSFLFADCPGRKPGRWLMQTGLVVYDLMAGNHGVRDSHFYADLATTQPLAPGLAPPGLRGALVFQDAKTDDARLVWRVLLEAQRDGATLLNYMAVQNLQTANGQVTGVVTKDALTGHTHSVQARAVVNATGAWADRLRAGVGAAPLLRPLRGSHLLLPFWRLPVACGAHSCWWQRCVQATLGRRTSCRPRHRCYSGRCWWRPRSAMSCPGSLHLSLLLPSRSTFCLPGCCRGLCCFSSMTVRTPAAGRGCLPAF